MNQEVSDLNGVRRTAGFAGGVHVESVLLPGAQAVQVPVEFDRWQQDGGSDQGTPPGITAYEGREATQRNQHKEAENARQLRWQSQGFDV